MPIFSNISFVALFCGNSSKISLISLVGLSFKSCKISLKFSLNSSFPDKISEIYGDFSRFNLSETDLSNSKPKEVKIYLFTSFFQAASFSFVGSLIKSKNF